jgi:hypothetical protein
MGMTRQKLMIIGNRMIAYEDGEREKTRWIRTKDALPENKSYVLTTIHVPGRQPHVRSGWYQDGLFMNDNGDCWKSTDREVLAWMYQPEPYAAEGGEG